MPSDRILALLKWTNQSSGHVGANRTLKLFKQWFHATWTDDQLRKTFQPILDKCPCRSCKPGDIRDRGLYSTLPIPHCAKSVLYVDYTEMPKFGGYNFALVATCGLTRFTRVFPCTKHITGEETIKILLQEWFCVYGAPREMLFLHCVSPRYPRGTGEPERLTKTRTSVYAPTLAGTRES